MTVRVKASASGTPFDADAMTPPTTAPPARHTGPFEGKISQDGAAVHAPMAELARQIIRQQWHLRNHPDPRRRGQARSLIRTHVILLRDWRELPLLVR